MHGRAWAGDNFLRLKKRARMWSKYTAVLDAVFEKPTYGCQTLKGVLSTLNAHNTVESRQVVRKHPEFAAVLAHLVQAEATAQALYSYVVRKHAVRACQLDHVRAMQKFVKGLHQSSH